jgi:aspartyl-tRNA(Asn)/glutamyl-tRNA(Gln) amidotransferase subunit B
VKNLNSFKSVRGAIAYEIERHVSDWMANRDYVKGKAPKENRGWSDDRGVTEYQRSKEEAHDYRYFPDPDLLPLIIDQAWIEQLRATMPELPQSKKARYVTDLGLSVYDASTLTASREMAVFFEAALQSVPKDAKICANWVMGEVSAQLNRDNLEMAQCPITSGQMGGMLARIVDGTISNAGAKEVFRTMWSEGGMADAIIDAKGLKQVSDAGALEAMVDEIIAANADKVAEYRSGKDKLFGFFVGLAMKASKGNANPAQMNEILKKKLAG